MEQSVYFQQVGQRLQVKSQLLSDSLNHMGMKALVDLLRYQTNHDITPDLAGFQSRLSIVTSSYANLINQALLKDSVLHDVGFNFEYTKVVLYRDGQTDTLLKPGSKPFLLAGNGQGNFLISEGKQEMSFEVEAAGLHQSKKFYRLAVWNKPSISASNWQQVVLKRMLTTLAGGIALMVALVFIFFLIFSALLRQKRIAEVTTDFANNMTHELKTPLSAAGLVVKSLRTPDAKLDEVWFEELLGQLDRQHGKIQRLMDNVLTSALDRPIGTLKLRQFMFKKIFDDLVLVASAAGRELLLAGKVDGLICTDADVLTAILSNLLDNAVKYTPDSSVITLNIQVSDRKIIISLEDQGGGIEKKYQGYLFQKFFRVPRSDSDQIKGLGLGLYLSRIQAHQLNGRLTYERSSKGGSIFNLILPNDKDTNTSC
ncbi:sensor histidine kinase [Pedobacter sp. NJ-S-72]